MVKCKLKAYFSPFFFFFQHSPSQCEHIAAALRSDHVGGDGNKELSLSDVFSEQQRGSDLCNQAAFVMKHKQALSLVLYLTSTAAAS